MADNLELKAVREMLNMTQAALEVSRQYDPPLLPMCKEIWAAEIIYNAMQAARTPTPPAGDVVERVARTIHNAHGDKSSTFASVRFHRETQATAALAVAPTGWREFLSTIVMNAELIPDPMINGTTDCYAVPLSDIDAARAALNEQEG